ncbi:MAG: hypothetical protein EX272_10375 [Chromatiales bacterium]|nr:MAG: hypothetical protein EX272_10375 [Chromatiales bacterium]
MIDRLRFASIAGLAAITMAGCSSTVTMEMPTIPEPRIEKIPVDVAVRIPAEFQNFVHVEEVLGKSTWTIDLGRSNANFFTQLFGHMFDSVVVLGPEDDPRDYQFDALIEPEIEGFEFATPEQSQSDAFAVWIRYRMSIFDSVGNRASSWTVNAYGKAQKEELGGGDSLKRAAILAMRDAAALIIMQMEKVTNIRQLADGPLAPEPADTETLQADAEQESEAPASVIGIFAIGGIDDAAE